MSTQSDPQMKLALAQKLIELAQARGMRPDQLLELLDINDPAALEAVLAPPAEDKPKYAFDRWDKKETPEEAAAREANDAKRKREERLKEIDDLRKKGILGE